MNPAASPVRGVARLTALPVSATAGRSKHLAHIAKRMREAPGHGQRLIYANRLAFDRSVAR